MSTRSFLLIAATLAAFNATAQENVIRKNLSERVPNIPKIDEVSKTPIAGLFEIRVNGSDVFYSDASGNYLLHGQLIETKTKRNLTEDRINKLTAVSYKDLPFKDAFTITRGDGKRQLAVFEDPNCGYCKKFEQELKKLDNVTIQMFLYPILGADSIEKSKNIWCAKDKGKAWQDWMLGDQIPAVTTCDTAALTRNTEFGRKQRITGTPTLIFQNGTRVPGAISVEQVEKYFSASN